MPALIKVFLFLTLTAQHLDYVQTYDPSMTGYLWWLINYKDRDCGFHILGCVPCSSQII